MDKKLTYPLPNKKTYYFENNQFNYLIVFSYLFAVGFELNISNYVIIEKIELWENVGGAIYSVAEL